MPRASPLRAGTGNGPARFHVGDPLWANSVGFGGRPGTAADFTTVAFERFYRLPAGVDPVATAAVHSGATAYLALHPCQAAIRRAGFHRRRSRWGGNRSPGPGGALRCPRHRLLASVRRRALPWAGNPACARLQFANVWLGLERHGGKSLWRAGRGGSSGNIRSAPAGPRRGSFGPSRTDHCPLRPGRHGFCAFGQAVHQEWQHPWFCHQQCHGPEPAYAAACVNGLRADAALPVRTVTTCPCRTRPRRKPTWSLARCTGKSCCCPEPLTSHPRRDERLWPWHWNWR